jgi:hypothetical protein
VWRLFAGPDVVAVRLLVAELDVAVRQFFAERVAARRLVAEPDVAVRRLFAEPDVAARRAPLGPDARLALPEPPALSVPVHWRLSALAPLPARRLRSGAKILS